MEEQKAEEKKGREREKDKHTHVRFILPLLPSLLFRSYQ
jgi:hypothetical protein